MKKLAALAGAGALFLSMAGPAFGCWWCHWGSDDVTVNNGAVVANLVMTKADSGDNSIHGKCVGGASIRTGAANAYTGVLNDVNSSSIACDGCDGDTTLRNRAFVLNGVYTKADTGDNDIHGKYVWGGSISTGAAGATSMVTNVVNFSAVGGPVLW